MTDGIYYTATFRSGSESEKVRGSDDEDSSSGSSDEDSEESEQEARPTGDSDEDDPLNSPLPKKISEKKRRKVQGPEVSVGPTSSRVKSSLSLRSSKIPKYLDPLSQSFLPDVAGSPELIPRSRWYSQLPHCQNDCKRVRRAQHFHLTTRTKKPPAAKSFMRFRLSLASWTRLPVREVWPSRLVSNIASAWLPRTLSQTPMNEPSL